MNNELDRELGWDDTIEKENEFILLPPGDYEFTVTNFERGRHNGSANLPACNKAVVDIKIVSDKGNTTIKHNLFLHTSTEGMLSNFFTGIGQKKKGEPLKMNWNQVVGSKGKCKVTVNKWTSNKTGEELQGNQIKTFYAPENQPVGQTQQPVQQQQQANYQAQSPQQQQQQYQQPAQQQQTTPFPTQPQQQQNTGGYQPGAF